MRVPHRVWTGAIVAGAIVSLVLATMCAVTLKVDVGHQVSAAPQPQPQPQPQPVPMSLARVAALGFAPPVPGSYQLERILHAPDGPVLDSDGRAYNLRDFTTGKITLFSFVYTYCTDAQGCPLAYVTLHAVRHLVANNPALRNHVRLVSMSFDPAFDTPAMMRSYGGADAKPGGPTTWHFLTTASRAELVPLLAGFGQDVAAIAPVVPGARMPVLRHLLKVYLLDPDGVVREIYAPAYLHPDVLYNDIVTVLMERRPPGERPAMTAHRVTSSAAH